MIQETSSLDKKIWEIEKQIQQNPHPFLLTTLERLKIRRDNDIDEYIKKIEYRKNKRYEVKGGFKGCGVS